MWITLDFKCLHNYENIYVECILKYKQKTSCVWIPCVDCDSSKVQKEIWFKRIAFRFREEKLWWILEIIVLNPNLLRNWFYFISFIFPISSSIFLSLHNRVKVLTNIGILNVSVLVKQTRGALTNFINQFHVIVTNFVLKYDSQRHHECALIDAGIERYKSQLTLKPSIA